MAMAREGGRGRAIAEINVTPMADVMIVLLVIFMVATSALNRESVRDLPPAVNGNVESESAGALVVSVARDGRPAMGNQPFATLQGMEAYVGARLEALPEGRRLVFVRAAPEVEYRDVARVVDTCRRAGVEQVALMTMTMARPVESPGSGAR